MMAAAGPGRSLTYTGPSVEVSSDRILRWRPVESQLDGVTAAFNLNVLTEGRRDKDGVYDLPHLAEHR